MTSLPPPAPGHLFRGLTPVLILLGLAGVFAVLQQLRTLTHAATPAFHQTDKGKRLDPWRPLPGCITLSDGRRGNVSWPVDAATQTTCTAQFGEQGQAVDGMTTDEAGFAPVLRALAPLRTPLKTSTLLPQSRLNVGESSYTAGADIRLTLVAARQMRASRLLRCLAGQLEVCPSVGIASDTWKHHYEDAAMRAGALLVMDLKTGAIEVAASTASACKTADEAGREPPDGCPVSARPRFAREWKLANQALFADEMPGSLVKPMLVLAMLRSDLGPGLLKPGPAQEQLMESIRKSETPDFLDHLLCRDKDFRDCKRLAALPAAARDLGWNEQAINLLEVESGLTLSLKAKPGRILKTPRQSRQWEEMNMLVDGAAAKRCAMQAQDRRWSKCRNEGLANLVAELWGQGNARVSLIAMANMLARLGAAADGQSRIGAPHLLAAVEGRVGEQDVRYQPAGVLSTSAIDPAHARLILAGMANTHQAGGTAHSACLKAQDHRPEAARRCASYLGVAGKTGTPVFNHDRLTDRERARICSSLRLEMASASSTARQNALRASLAQCDLAPLKWYAALVRDDPTRPEGPWSKVVVALAERNWRKDGHIDAAYDRGSNIAAEMVFRYIGLIGEEHEPQRRIQP